MGLASQRATTNTSWLLKNLSESFDRLRVCEKIAARPSTSSGRTAKYLNYRCTDPFVLRLSKHERIFSHTLSQIMPLLREDPSFMLVPVANESEGVSIAAGASLGGRPAAVYMEGSGVDVSSDNLLVLGKKIYGSINIGL